MRLVMLGPPGAGKGTQAAKLAARFGIPILSSGNMMRDEASSGSELGRRVQEALAQGVLLSDDLVLSSVFGVLDRIDLHKGFLMDGFPRTVSQATALDRYLSTHNLSLDVALSLDLNNELLLQRVLLRAREAEAHGQSARVDDNARAFIVRMDEYRRHAESLHNHYAHAGLLRTIDASASPEIVAVQILAAISS